MTQVGLLTQEQADQLMGVEFATDNFFNPVIDKNNNWIISIEEIDRCNLEWVKKLPLIDCEPVEFDISYV